MTFPQPPRPGSILPQPKRRYKPEPIPRWGKWLIGIILGLILLAVGILIASAHLETLGIFFLKVIQLILIGLLLMVYFGPALIAKGTPRAAAIFIANLVFGWTILGWIIALIWALGEQGSANAPPRKHISVRERDFHS